MIKEFKNTIKMNKSLYSFLQSAIRLVRKDKSAPSYEDLFSNVKGGNLEVTLKNIPGVFKIDARSHILGGILLTKEYETEIVNHIHNNIDPNKDAINVGANIGLFTNLLASSISDKCKVLAIEPTPNAFKSLEDNVECNGHSSKVITYNGIATDKSGDYNINVIPGKEEYSSIGEMVHPFTKNEEHVSVEVKGETIDNLVIKFNLTPGIIVIDVEGAEYSVLKGSVNTIKNSDQQLSLNWMTDYFVYKTAILNKLLAFLKGTVTVLLLRITLKYISPL